MTDNLKRLSVNLHPTVVDALNDLVERRQTTISQVIREAILTEQFIVRAVDDGGKVFIRRKDGSIVEVYFR